MKSHHYKLAAGLDRPNGYTIWCPYMPPWQFILADGGCGLKILTQIFCRMKREVFPHSFSSDIQLLLWGKPARTMQHTLRMCNHMCTTGLLLMYREQLCHDALTQEGMETCMATAPHSFFSCFLLFFQLLELF